MATALDQHLSTETPLEATERLRQEGRWEAARRYCERQRLRLRSEGKPRKEAREEAWELTIEAYAPPDHEAFARYMELATYPPTSCPQTIQRGFTDIWAVVCHFKAECYMYHVLAGEDDSLSATRVRLGLEDPEALAAVCEAESTDLWQAVPQADPPAALPDRCSIKGTFALHAWAIEFPLLFLDLAQTTLTKVMNTVSGTSSLAEATKAELRALLDGLPSLREAVLKHWPAEFTG